MVWNIYYEDNCGSGAVHVGCEPTLAAARDDFFRASDEYYRSLNDEMPGFGYMPLLHQPETRECDMNADAYYTVPEETTDRFFVLIGTCGGSTVFAIRETYVERALHGDLCGSTVRV